MPRLVIAAATLAAATALAGCSNKPAPRSFGRPLPSGPTTTLAAANPDVTGTIDAADQASDGTRFSIAAASIDGSPHGGWIAMHRDDSGKLGPVVGTVHIPPGASHDVVGAFSDKQPNGARFWAALHADDHVPNAFEYTPHDKADLPVRSGADLVMQHITIRVP